MSEAIEIGILAYIKALEDRLSQVIGDANYIVSNHNQGASILECNEQDLLQDMTSATVFAKRPKILEDLLERKFSHDSNVSQDVNSEHHAFEKPAFWDEFERWWETHGQYCRAGGGDYEKSFAWAAFEYLKAQSPIAQNEQQEAVAYIYRNEYNEYRLEPDDNFNIKTIPMNEHILLYKSPPKQAIPEDVIKDAERYNWLKQNYHGFEMFRHSTIPYVTLDREVDKAMLNSAPTNTEVGE